MSKPYGGLNESARKSGLGLSSVGRRWIGLNRGERRRIRMAADDLGFTLSKLLFDNTNTISTCHSRPMNLRSCVLRSVWRCCTTITIVYGKRSAGFPVAPIFMI